MLLQSSQNYGWTYLATTFFLLSKALKFDISFISHLYVLEGQEQEMSLTMCISHSNIVKCL